MTFQKKESSAVAFDDFYLKRKKIVLNSHFILPPHTHTEAKSREEMLLKLMAILWQTDDETLYLEFNG